MTTKIKSISTKFFLIFFTAMFFLSCENNPSDLGFTLLPSNDTVGVSYLDSQIDTMPISYNNYKQYINTSSSINMLVGNYQNYQSTALIKFIGISPDYDSVDVLSAVLTLKSSGYYFEDQTGTTAFNLFKVNSNLNYSAITFDSVNSSTFGTTSLGNFSGVVADTATLNITMDNQTADDWLEYAADSNYINKNYGIGLLPSAGSTTIKGFYSNINDGVIPYVTIIFTKNNVEDTITLITSQYVSLSNVSSLVIPPDRFILQNGIAYRNILNFDLSKLPGNVIINNATLLFTLDNANSYISATTNKAIVIGAVTDSITKTDSLTDNSFLLDSIVYSANLNSIVQRWNTGALQNLGITMKNISEIQNLDNFVFYSPASSDSTKRPRLKITYTKINR
ncbi:MAG: DNRLRE domain-containing protein [bacterium]